MIVFRKVGRPLEASFADMDRKMAALAIDVVRYGQKHIFLSSIGTKGKEFLERCGYAGAVIDAHGEGDDLVTTLEKL